MDVGKLLDRAKRAAHIESDYALAKRIGTSHSRVSNWRRGANVPDERATLALCELSGDDAGVTIARMQSMRAANAEAASVWRLIADRLARPETAKIAVLFALVLVAQFLGGLDADALPLLAGFAFENLYIVSICLAVTLLTPLGLRVLIFTARRLWLTLHSRR